MRKKTPAHFILNALRHHPDSAGIVLDQGGWVDTNLLLEAILKNYPAYSMEQLKEEILQNERYSFFDDSCQKVRADYGHSCGLKLENLFSSSSVPPAVLYHGTERQARDSILGSGIHRQKRDHVFLTDNLDVAMKKALRRHTPPAIIVVDAKKMEADGYLFYHVKNDIWLTYDVPKEYILDVKYFI